MPGGAAAGPREDSVLGCAAELWEGPSRAGVRRAEAGTLKNRVDTCGVWGNTGTLGTGKQGGTQSALTRCEQATGQHTDCIHRRCARQGLEHAHTTAVQG